jgi:hypothetical protein
MVRRIEQGQHACTKSFATAELLYQDARAADDSENVPIDAIQLTQVAFQETWLFLLRDVVQPIQQKVFTGYFSDVSSSYQQPNPIQWECLFVSHHEQRTMLLCVTRPNYNRNKYSGETILRRTR